MDIKVSVIIPFYNVEKELLRQCINSILHQDFQDYEIIIVDDGSEEKFSGFLPEIERIDKRIKIVHQNNKGLSAARNTGIGYAMGEYVTFVDADDLLVPYFFSEAYKIAMENSADFVIGGELYTSSRGTKVFRNTNPQVDVVNAEQYKPSSIMITRNLSGGGCIGRGAWARFVRKTILEKVPFQEDVRMGEDIIWNLDMLAKCEKVFIVHQIWYIYWINPISMTQGYNANMVNLCDKHLDEILRRINMEKEKEAVAFCSHTYEILNSLIYRCFLGRKESSLSVFQRNRMFCDLCKREPWVTAQDSPFIKKCDRKTRLKHFLAKHRMLYWFLFLRNHTKRAA